MSFHVLGWMIIFTFKHIEINLGHYSTNQNKFLNTSEREIFSR